VSELIPRHIYFCSTSVFSALDVCYENALYKYNFDIDIDIAHEIFVPGPMYSNN